MFHKLHKSHIHIEAPLCLTVLPTFHIRCISNFYHILQRRISHYINVSFRHYAFPPIAVFNKPQRNFLSYSSFHGHSDQVADHDSRIILHLIILPSCVCFQRLSFTIHFDLKIYIFLCHTPSLHISFSHLLVWK